jgi:hypothetical protein
MMAGARNRAGSRLDRKRIGMGWRPGRVGLYAGAKPNDPRQRQKL